MRQLKEIGTLPVRALERFAAALAGSNPLRLVEPSRNESWLNYRHWFHELKVFALSRRIGVVFGFL